jgi:UDP-glucose:(heptosyl)LPS alpha-1,3-glucosyltransferase
MKIAFIVRKYQTSGGTERYTYNISNALAEKGHNITIFCNKSNITPPNRNIHIVKIPQLPLGRTIKTFWFYLCTKGLNLKNYDIVQGSGKVTAQDIYRAGGGFHKLFLREKGKQSDTFYDKAVMKIEKEIYNPLNTKFIISVSNYIAKEINTEFNFPLNRIAVFHNPVDLKFFNTKNRDAIKAVTDKKYNIPENYVKFLFVANNFKLKGLPLIIRTLNYFENFKLFIIGGDNLQKTVENIPQKIKDKIVHVGEKKGEDLVNFFKSCDVLLHPTVFDPFANVCLEAMACGLPVVTTKINGASEILENFKDGIVIEHSEDKKNFKIAVEKLIFNRNFLKQLSENALKTVKNYSIERYAEKLTDFYIAVLKEKKNV